jgi:hypothetical protein
MRSIFGVSLLICMAVPGFADAIFYNNGPATLASTPTYSISGSVAGNPAIVSDTFTIAGTTTILTSIELALWLPSAATMTSLSYCVSGNSGCTSAVDETGTAALTLLSNVGSASGFTLNEYTFNLQRLNYGAGTYWLQVSNANVSSGIAYWDTNGGVGCTGDGAGSSPANGCPSGAVWSLQETPIATQGVSAGNNSESFQVFGAPEPAGFVLGGAGLLALAGFARRRRRVA